MLSLYIPILSESFINEDFLKTLFVNKKLGEVDHVDVVHNLEKARHEAFVHFKEWFDTPESKNFQEDVQNTSTKTKIYYTTKNFIPVLVNTNPDRVGENPNYMPVREGEEKMMLALKLMPTKTRVYEENYGAKLVKDEDLYKVKLVKPI